MALTNQAATPERPSATQSNPHDGAQLPSKHIVLTTFGSLEDLHPYMAVALELGGRN